MFFTWFTMNCCTLEKPDVTSDSGSAFNSFVFVLTIRNSTCPVLFGVFCSESSFQT